MDLELLSPIFYRPSTAVSVSVSPDSHYDAVIVSSGNTSTFTATPSGGTAPYTYSWTLLSQSGDGTVSVDTPTASSTSLDYTGLVSTGQYVDYSFQCTVLDSFGATAYSIVSGSVNRVF